MGKQGMIKDLELGATVVGRGSKGGRTEAYGLLQSLGWGPGGECSYILEISKIK